MIAFIFCITFAVLFSIGITYFFIPIGMGLHYYVPFLLLIGGYLAALILLGLFLFISSRFFSFDKQYKKPSKFAEFVLADMCKFIMIHARVKLVVKGASNIPHGNYMFICNHRSNFDPIVYMATYGKKNFAFISKESNGRIPIVGRFMAGAKYLTINREDKLKSLQTMKEAGELIKNGIVSIGVFPEGTRSKGLEINPFHEGVFSIAKAAHCQIVVASVQSTELIHKHFPWRRTVVTLKIIEVLDPVDYLDETVKDVSDYCYRRIRNSLDDLVI